MSDRRLSKATALLLFAIAAAGLLLSTYIDDAVLPLLGDMNVQLKILIANLLYYVPFTVVPAALCLFRGENRPQIRKGNLSVRALALTVMAALLCVYLVNDLAVLWAIPFEQLGFNINNGGMIMPVNARELVICVITAGVLPAVCEELLFRGAIMNAFETEGTRYGIYMTALFFMLLHGTVLGAPTQFLLGVIIAVIVVSCDSIYAGMIFHTVYNTTLVVLQYMQNTGVEEEAADLLTQLGGISGLLMLIPELLLMTALLSYMMRAFIIRRRLRGVKTFPGKKHRFSRTEIILLVLCAVLAATEYVLDVVSML